MDDALATIVAVLLKTVLGLPQFAALASPGTQRVEIPIVRLVPQADIAMTVCGAPCGARAYYLSEKGVLLDDQLDLANDAFARSVLFHELVHYAQDKINAYGDAPECDRKRLRERDAYALQNQFLMHYQSPVHVGNATQFSCSTAPLAAEFEP
jgi:hypothetical protein